MRQEAINFVQNQLIRADARLNAYLQNPKGAKNPTRNIIVKIRQYYKDFLDQKGSQRWIIMPGLRGVGKTTIMAQTYFEVSLELQKHGLPKNRLLFISLDDAVENLDIHLNEILEAYELILGVPFEKQTSPLFIFIDEAQYEPKWGTVLKALFDRCKNVFIFCTGSSALELRSNPDVARRSILERLYPMNFLEYEKIRNDVTPIKGLKDEIKQALYGPDSYEQGYQRLKETEKSVAQYWSKVDTLDIDHYLEIGTFPFALKYPDKYQVYEALNQLIDKIINTDVPKLGGMRVETIAMMRRLLYLLADATDVLAASKLAGLMGTNSITMTAILDVLKDAECLIKIPPYGSATSSVRKASKYCFMSPAIRAALLSIAGSDGALATRKGKYWEDTVALHLYREFSSKRVGNVVYDPSAASADFVLQMTTGQEIAIEVGAGQKGITQALNTMKQRKIEKGLVISASELAISEDKRVLMIPFRYFLLM